MLNGVGVEEDFLRIEAQRLELLVEFVARNELAALGQRIDDLLFARIVVAIKLHAEVIDLAQRLAGREHDRLERFAQRAREAGRLSSFTPCSSCICGDAGAMLRLDPLLDLLNGAHAPRACRATS